MQLSPSPLVEFPKLPLISQHKEKEEENKSRNWREEGFGCNLRGRGVEFLGRGRAIIVKGEVGHDRVRRRRSRVAVTAVGWRRIVIGSSAASATAGGEWRRRGIVGAGAWWRRGRRAVGGGGGR